MEFELRRVDEIKKDIDTVKSITEEIKQIAWGNGFEGNLKKASAQVHSRPPNDSFRIVAQWLYFGGDKVFLQDANSIVMKTSDLVEVLEYLKEQLPGIYRVTSYGRSQTVAKKSLEELKDIRAAGLSRLHMGLESGSDEVLKFVRKGVTAAEHISGGQKVVESGISLCEYVMPGVGGKRLSEIHAEETARVLNQINPNFIRLRSLMIREDLPLYQKWQDGEFELMMDDGVVWEIRELICRLEVTSYLASDHIENLLQEVEGKLPDDKGKMIDIIDRYLALPADERLNFRLGRRAGYYVSLDDLNNISIRGAVDTMLYRMRAMGEDHEGTMFNLKKRFLV